MKNLKDLRPTGVLGEYAVPVHKNGEMNWTELQRIGRPENCVTAWELFRDYGISRQKTSRAIRMGKLNGFMIGTEKEFLVKWFIHCDELLDEYIRKNSSPRETGTSENHQADS